MFTYGFPNYTYARQISKGQITKKLKQKGELFKTKKSTKGNVFDGRNYNTKAGG